MSNFDTIKKESKEDDQYNNIKKLLKEKNLNLKDIKDLKYLLSLTLESKIRKFNFEYLLSFLLKYLEPENESIFYEFLFQSCEIGKLSNVKILLENGLSVNCQNDFGETPLHIAISRNDIELVKLLVKYEPNMSLSTYKDNFNALNYAEIRGNKKIIKLINDLNEKNNQKLIKSEIIDYINKDMKNIDNIDCSNLSSFVNKNNNFDEIQNYNGEKISIMTNEDENNSITNNNLNINIGEISNKSIKNKKIKTLEILNESDFCEDITPKNTIKVNNYSNNLNTLNIINNINNSGKVNDENYLRFLTEECYYDKKIPNKFKPELKYYTSNLKKGDELLNYNNNRSINPSCGQSLTTSHTLNREIYESPLFIHKISNTMNKKIELSNFMIEINVSNIYAKYLLINGFDDLEVLISQTKKGEALSDQNLRDIGVSLPGDRAKILIHLEELAGNFPFLLEKNIIYSNKNGENENSSLYKFLSSINLEEYIKTFKDNGYYNAELLYIQMVSKYPMTEDILKNDFGLNKLGYIKKIMINLINNSQNYIKKLKIKENDKNKNSIVYESNPYTKACDACNIF